MVQNIKLIVYPAKDLAVGKKFFSRLLGVEPYADAPYYVGYRIGDQEIGLDPNADKQGITGPVAYVEVSDIKTSLKSMQEAGAQIHQDVKDVGGGKLIALLKNKNGNIVGITQNPK